MRRAICTSDKPKPRFTTTLLKKRPAGHNGKHPGGRPTAYGPRIAKEICTRIASGDTLRAACIALRIPEDTVYGWLSSHDEFRQTYAHARDVRADVAFAEQMLDIADNTSDDRVYNAKTGKLTIAKEAVLRSRVRIEMRQWQMQRRHPLKWGDRTQIEVKDDFSGLTIEEKMRKAMELLSPRPGD